MESKCNSRFDGFALRTQAALFNPKTSILIQKRHPYNGNLKSETLGDSKNEFLHWGDVLANAWLRPMLCMYCIYLEQKNVHQVQAASCTLHCETLNLQ